MKKRMAMLLCACVLALAACSVPDRTAERTLDLGTFRNKAGSYELAAAPWGVSQSDCAAVWPAMRDYPKLTFQEFLLTDVHEYGGHSVDAVLMFKADKLFDLTLRFAAAPEDSEALYTGLSRELSDLYGPGDFHEEVSGTDRLRQIRWTAYTEGRRTDMALRCGNRGSNDPRVLLTLTHQPERA